MFWNLGRRTIFCCGSRTGCSPRHPICSSCHGGEVARARSARLRGRPPVNRRLSRLSEGSAGNVQAADRVGRAAEHLDAAAGSLDQAARETVDISTTVERRAQAGVRQAEQATVRVSEIAVLARSTVQRMVALREASTRIRRITHVVGDITTQTNLLAINCSIEAARAGEHGRGFGVVAEEVRGLAGESAQSLSEIEELLGDRESHGRGLWRDSTGGTRGGRR